MGVFPPGITFSTLIQQSGRLWGYSFTRHGRRYLDWRCSAFPLNISGAKHLCAALEQPCLIVANHVIIRAENAPFGRMTQLRALSLLNQPPDSFILRRIVREESGLRLHVVAKSDRGWWSPRRVVKAFQKRIGQPFGKGMMEGMEFIPVEHNPACFHRTFFESAAKPIQRGRPILIFPGKIRCDENGCEDSLITGNIGEARILPGAAHLARRFALPILPAFLSGCNSWRPDEPIYVAFGPAIHAEEMTKIEINHAIIEQVRALAPYAKR